MQRRWPGPFPTRPGLVGRWVVPVVAYLVAAVGLTWPLAAHLSSRLPLGSEHTATGRGVAFAGTPELTREYTGRRAVVYRLSTSAGAGG